MRVTNEQAEKIKALCKSTSNTSCYGCQYADDKYEYCPSTWNAPQLAADLLESRELIKEMRSALEVVRDNTRNTAHTLTMLGLQETTNANHRLSLAILERTKEYQ